MKKSFFILCMIILFTVLSVEKSVGQHEKAIQEQIKWVKAKTDFANWGPETGQVIPGVAISEKFLPQLSALRKVWREDNYSRENIKNFIYIKIRKWWRLEENEFDATMVVGLSFEAAKEYLILRYVETQREPPLIKTPGRKLGLKIGNVCFVTTEDEGKSFSSIDFIRHNVLIMMRAGGDMQKELKNIAETLDDILLEKKPEKNYHMLPELPKIKTFSAKKAKIKLGKEALLTVEVNNPQKRELRYFWTITGGGVKKDLLENFVFYGGEAGKQSITVTVVNDLGLYDSRSVDIEVGQP